MTQCVTNQVVGALGRRRAVAPKFARAPRWRYNRPRSLPNFNSQTKFATRCDTPFRSAPRSSTRARFCASAALSQGKETLLSNYELTFILRPADETTLTAAQDRIAGQVQNAGGEIVARHDWGRRRLAYPIQKNKDGYYTTLYASLPGSAVRGIERAFKLNDQVLRYLFVRVEQFVLPQTPAPNPSQKRLRLRRQLHPQKGVEHGTRSQ
ncbi:MAG: 30S ribosomal protein S6 [Chloroflexi bacterium]|nr:MAG: 30S ribosomal protein S6 [Chloroflexota bacterium]